MNTGQVVLPKTERVKIVFGTARKMDAREMCKFCFNEYTERIVDPIELEPYRKHHRTDSFKAFKCSACGGSFHFKLNLQ